MATLAEFARAFRAAPPAAAARPDLSGLGARFADPPAQLVASVAAAGGLCLRVADLAAARAALAELPAVAGARRVASLVPGVVEATLDPGALADPRALDGLDLAVLPGALAVAENGAVWVDTEALPLRALYVIAEHLVLVVEAPAVVNDMHEAYARLAARPGPPGHGVFIAGPSKTADIEQALVIGAQGPRSCTVLLVG